MRSKFLISLVMALAAGSAQGATVSWAADYLDSAQSPYARRALGAPDAAWTSMSFVRPAHLSVSGFTSGTAYATDALLAALRVGEDVLARADFIAFEFNGWPGNPFEAATFEFDDGSTTQTVAFTPGSAGTGAVVAEGGLYRGAYAALFGTPVMPAAGEFKWILLDLAVDTASPDLMVTVRSAGGSMGSPELDALGTLTAPVPLPPAAFLLAFPLLALIAIGRRRPA